MRVHFLNFIYLYLSKNLHYEQNENQISNTIDTQVTIHFTQSKRLLESPVFECIYK